MNDELHVRELQADKGVFLISGHAVNRIYLEAFIRAIRDGTTYSEGSWPVSSSSSEEVMPAAALFNQPLCWTDSHMVDAESRVYMYELLPQALKHQQQLQEDQQQQQQQRQKQQQKQQQQQNHQPLLPFARGSALLSALEKVLQRCSDLRSWLEAPSQGQGDNEQRTQRLGTLPAILKALPQLMESMTITSAENLQKAAAAAAGATGAAADKPDVGRPAAPPLQAKTTSSKLNDPAGGVKWTPLLSEAAAVVSRSAAYAAFLQSSFSGGAPGITALPVKEASHNAQERAASAMLKANEEVRKEIQAEKALTQKVASAAAAAGTDLAAAAAAAETGRLKTGAAAAAGEQVGSSTPTQKSRKGSHEAPGTGQGSEVLSIGKRMRRPSQKVLGGELMVPSPAVDPLTALLVSLSSPECQIIQVGSTEQSCKMLLQEGRLRGLAMHQRVLGLNAAENYSRMVGKSNCWGALMEVVTGKGAVKPGNAGTPTAAKGGKSGSSSSSSSKGVEGNVGTTQLLPAVMKGYDPGEAEQVIADFTCICAGLPLGEQLSNFRVSQYVAVDYSTWALVLRSVFAQVPCLRTRKNSRVLTSCSCSSYPGLAFQSVLNERACV